MHKSIPRFSTDVSPLFHALLSGALLIGCASTPVGKQATLSAPGAEGRNAAVMAEAPLSDAAALAPPAPTTQALKPKAPTGENRRDHPGCLVDSGQYSGCHPGCENPTGGYSGVAKPNSAQ
ncbi:hypothetical protein [Neosynechococcus sphagnicola]|uniref:hypothetical protein n=1 Tax=Neosynechococcus sphagnicola TaxID=1501145 RepID=UPI001EF9F3D1|nr:hypothetical protein [Neosynechococcus sphagnicola]